MAARVNESLPTPPVTRRFACSPPALYQPRLISG
jgi:hypothetical protein